MKFKTEEIYKDFSNDEEIFDFSNYSTIPTYYDRSNKSVVGKMKDETAGVVIEEFFVLKLKIYLYLIHGSSENKKVKNVKKNVVPTISYNKYKDVLLNKKCLRHSMNRTQSKDHRIGTYKIDKIFLSCFDHEIYIQLNGLALGYLSCLNSYKTQLS